MSGEGDEVLSKTPQAQPVEVGWTEVSKKSKWKEP